MSEKFIIILLFIVIVSIIFTIVFLHQDDLTPNVNLIISFLSICISGASIIYSSLNVQESFTGKRKITLKKNNFIETMINKIGGKETPSENLFNKIDSKYTIRY